jgi:autophagy-related protein 17
VDEGSEASDDGRAKTLYDFIDEATHEEILSSIRALIDTYHIARADLDANLDAFDASLKSVRTTLTSPLSVSEEDVPPDKPTIYEQQPAGSVPELFHNMESHATELASLLENLVKHYDLCVTALKHTEGGGEAAKEAILAQDLSKTTPASEESLYRTTHPEPISDEHRNEMLHVLENDAVEVEDVVVEIRDHAAEIETAYASLSMSVRKARALHKSLQHVLSMLHDARAAVPSYLDGATRFRDDWTDIAGGMHSKTKDLVELCGFYDHFLGGYGKLLREVERRRTSEAHMQRIVDRARREIERVAEADGAAREAFMEDVGSYLPRDLGAWFGLEDEAVKWEVNAVLGAGDQSGPRLMDG